MREPSGDHAGCVSLHAPEVICFWSSPFALITYRW